MRSIMGKKSQRRACFNQHARFVNCSIASQPDRVPCQPHGEEKPKSGILQSACPLCELFYRAPVLPRPSPIAPPASPTRTDLGHTCFAEAFG